MFPAIFGGAFSLCGLVGLWLAWRTFAKDRAISRWPRAQGRVTVSRVDSRTATARDAQGYTSAYTVHEPVVHYTYEVDGRAFEGTRLARVVMASDRKPDLGPYPVGAGVLVYYDPENPATAYLEVRRSTGAVIIGAMGALFLLIGVLVPALVLLG